MKKFTLGLNAAKNTDYIKKYFKKTLHRIKFNTKNLEKVYSLSLPGMELENSRNLFFFNIKH